MQSLLIRYHMFNNSWKFSNTSPVNAVLMQPAVLEKIDQWRQKLFLSQPEACGILLGERRGFEGKEQYINITDITLPYVTDIRKPTAYIRNTEGHQDYLDELHKRSKGKIQYLGEWHSHPQNKASPSSIDYREWNTTCVNFLKLPLIFYIAGVQEDWIGVQVDQILYIPKP